LLTFGNEKQGKKIT